MEMSTDTSTETESEAEAAPPPPRVKPPQRKAAREANRRIRHEVAAVAPPKRLRKATPMVESEEDEAEQCGALPLLAEPRSAHSTAVLSVCDRHAPPAAAKKKPWYEEEESEDTDDTDDSDEMDVEESAAAAAASPNASASGARACRYIAAV